MINRSFIMIFLVVLIFIFFAQSVLKRSTDSSRVMIAPEVVKEMSQRVVGGEGYEFSFSGDSLKIIGPASDTLIVANIALENSIRLFLVQSDEFKTREGFQKFMGLTDLGFMACLYEDIGLDPAMLSTFCGKKISEIKEAQNLWRKIMGFGKRDHYDQNKYFAHRIWAKYRK